MNGFNGFKSAILAYVFQSDVVGSSESSRCLCVGYWIGVSDGNRREQQYVTLGKNPVQIILLYICIIKKTTWIFSVLT